MQMCGKGDGERMQKHNNSSSMKRQRLLETTNGRTIALISKETVVRQTLEL